MDKGSLLQKASFGGRVAEEEGDRLAAYFVETHQWRSVFNGEVDVVRGPKGSGKSAIYSLLLDRQSELFDRNIIVVAGENPRGTTAFSGLVADPPSTEFEFTNLWKLYLLTLIADVLIEYGVSNADADSIVNILVEARLLHPDDERITLGRRLRTILDYVRPRSRLESVEAGISIEPTTGTPALVGKITFAEPTASEHQDGFVSADEMLRVADQALAVQNLSIWILLDRLDVAFADSRDLEGNALRALFQVYVGMLGLDSIKTKIFLRQDIWSRILEEGFREASHITRMTDISWDDSSLLNLIIRRALNNEAVVEYYDCDKVSVLANIEEQERLFYRVFPRQVEAGPRKSNTLTWMLNRTKDGSGRTAPRELIHLLEAAREEQIHALELGGNEPDGEQMISATVIKNSLPVVSKFRLDQTLFAEYPEFKDSLTALEGQKSEQTSESLGQIWQMEPEEANRQAQSLVEIGFFEERREQGTYWVPFLYRSALSLVQGRAERPPAA